MEENKEIKTENEVKLIDLTYLDIERLDGTINREMFHKQLGDKLSLSVYSMDALRTATKIHDEGLMEFNEQNKQLVLECVDKNFIALVQLAVRKLFKEFEQQEQQD